MNKNDQGKILGFQVLRGWCCLGIVFAHSFAYAEKNLKTLDYLSLMFPFRIGMLNYTLFFFVLSGFLTARRISLGSSIKIHLKSRFYGIYPIYWLSLLFVILIKLFVFNRIEVSYDFWKSLLLFPGDHTYLCNVEWTLIWEMFFYLLVTPFMKSTFKYFFPFFSVGTLLLIFIYEKRWVSVLIPLLEPGSLGLTSLRWLMIGSIIYYIYEKIYYEFQRKNNRIILFYIVVMMIFSTYLLDPQLSNNLFANGGGKGYLIFSCMAFAVLFLFRNIEVKDSNLFVIIGNNSYVIYLLHATFFDAIFYLLNKVGFKFNLLVDIILTGIIILLNCYISRWFLDIVRALRVKKE